MRYLQSKIISVEHFACDKKSIDNVERIPFLVDLKNHLNKKKLISFIVPPFFLLKDETSVKNQGIR